MANAKKRGRPRKDTRAVLAAYGDAKAGRIYRDWYAFYQNAALPRFGVEKTARGSANRMMAHEYGLTTRQIQNIVTEGDALMRTIETERDADAVKTRAAQRAFDELYLAVEQAAALLRKPAYKDLLDGCAMHPVVTTLPKALGEFSSAPTATAPDSLQRLAAVLAEGLLRAHEIAEREAPGYSERKIPARR
jgi:hypothetical protein